MTDIRIIQIRAGKKNPHIRRAGIDFAREPREVDWDKLTPEQRKALEGEKWLLIEQKHTAKAKVTPTLTTPPAQKPKKSKPKKGKSKPKKGKGKKGAK